MGFSVCDEEGFGGFQLVAKQKVTHDEEKLLVGGKRNTHHFRIFVQIAGIFINETESRLHEYGSIGGVSSCGGRIADIFLSLGGKSAYFRQCPWCVS